MLDTIQRSSVISFPMLGNLRLNPPAYFMILGYPVYFYGLIIGLGFLCGITFSARRARRFGIREDDFYDAVLWLIPCSILGARLYYVAFNLSYYARHPGELFAVWNGGLAIYGGVIGGALAVALVCRKKKIPVPARYFLYPGAKRSLSRPCSTACATACCWDRSSGAGATS